MIFRVYLLSDSKSFVHVWRTAETSKSIQDCVKTQVTQRCRNVEPTSRRWPNIETTLSQWCFSTWVHGGQHNRNHWICSPSRRSGSKPGSDQVKTAHRARSFLGNFIREIGTSFISFLPLLSEETCLSSIFSVASPRLWSSFLRLWNLFLSNWKKNQICLVILFWAFFSFAKILYHSL